MIRDATLAFEKSWNLERAILETVAYADVFDYPLTPAEIHRYLHFVPVPQETVGQVLHSSGLLRDYLEKRGGFYMLPGRTELATMRRRREALAERAWPTALRYGRKLAGLPFVRMVALTGSLAMHNADGDADFDYLLVAEPGRVWTSRAWSLLVAQLAAIGGIRLCPNFIISSANLEMDRRDLYTAHELAQMVPLAGEEIYGHLRSANAWSAAYLPNAAGPPDGAPRQNPASQALRSQPLLAALGEAALRLPPGDWLERWEMRRKINKLTRQSGPGKSGPGLELCFSADRCQGHFQAHGQGSLAAFGTRLEGLPAARIPGSS